MIIYMIIGIIIALVSCKFVNSLFEDKLWKRFTNIIGKTKYLRWMNPILPAALCLQIIFLWPLLVITTLIGIIVCIIYKKRNKEKLEEMANKHAKNIDNAFNAFEEITKDI